MKNQKLTKKYVVPLIHWMGMKQLEQAAAGPTWKTVWSAGQSVGLVDEILSCDAIMQKLVREYGETVTSVPKPQ
jgi:nitronate monooxygenase